jgi:hypothetical protein
MKMDGSAWRDDADGFVYKLQVNDIKHGDKNILNKLFKEWNITGHGWNIKDSSEVKIFKKEFKSEAEWVEWAKQCPFKVVEKKYRAGVVKEIQHSCKTRKKRATK